MSEPLVIGGVPATTEQPKRKAPVKYSFEVAEALLIAIAEGKTLVEIANDPEMPSRNTIYRWLTQYPKFFDAYERAKEVSAQSLEDEALIIARNLSGTNDYTGVKVTALNYAMQQLRWSAARRDPARYGQKVDGATTIPIQINTTLNLGQDGQPAATDNTTSVYHVEAVVQVAPRQYDTPDTDDDRPLTIDAEPEEPTPAAFDPPVTEAQQLVRGKPGRPVGSRQGPHKSAKATKATITRNAKKEK